MQNSFDCGTTDFHSVLPGIDTLTTAGYNAGNRMEVRHQVREGVYVVIDAHAPQICQIKDLSTGGLSYVYYSDNDYNIDSLYLDILVQGDGFCIENIPYRKVADFEIANTGSARFASKRQVSIKFEKLTEEQTHMIEDFIDNVINQPVN